VLPLEGWMGSEVTGRGVHLLLGMLPPAWAIWRAPTCFTCTPHVYRPGVVTQVCGQPDSSAGLAEHTAGHHPSARLLASFATRSTRFIEMQICVPAGLGCGLAPRGGALKAPNLQARFGAAPQRRRPCRTMAARQVRNVVAVASMWEDTAWRLRPPLPGTV